MKMIDDIHNSPDKISFEYFDFTTDYIFENDAVKISPFKVDEIEKLIHFSEEKDIWTYFLDSGKGRTKFKKYCLSAIHNRENGTEYPFVVFDKRIGEYAGMTRLYEYNPKLRTIKMGHTWIGQKFWGTKLNMHLKFLLFEFIFQNLGLERIGFGVHGQNTRSTMALKKNGCTQEGVLRNFLPGIHKDERFDLILFSLLKNEWNASVKKMLARNLK